MPRRLAPLDRLRGDQRLASGPREHAALSASAGTGKTHVLTARVLRLLLARVDPASILCLTFTKAGAAEMAERIHARLAHWVRLKDADLGSELAALGEDPTPENRENARTLFARVLDAAGGGLRIQTIHAFAQSLLAAFPAEAGLAPGFRPLEGREEKHLARETLAELLLRAERSGDPLVRDVQSLSHRLGEAGVEGFLLKCAHAPDAMAALGPAQGIEARLRRAFGVPSGDVEAAIAAQCDDALFDVVSIERIGLLNRAWGSPSGLERAALCEAWLSAGPVERARMLEELHSVWARKDGGIRAFSRGQAPADEGYPALAAAAFERCAALIRIRAQAALVALLAAGLRAGQTFAMAYARAKSSAGLVDFDDLIRWAERLLLTDGMGDWVRYKLDQATDHILVDEAQDTNEKQWNIVWALAEEYFAGEGASQRRRTIFTVGDFKQAIFGFQGTDPREFEKARRLFSEAAAGVRRRFLDLSMDLSFRSVPPILTFVDRLLADLGPQALGLPQPANLHEAHHAGRAGSVTLWRPYIGEAGEEASGEEGWVSDVVRGYAATLARRIRTWLDAPFALAGKQGKSRPVRPEDILILVRRRGELASLIVARLHAEGVPVAGVDRLLLTAPLAVQDLLAAMRFAVQPLDDLNLASLLVSPLFGWTQDELFDLAHGREGALWPQLRRAAAPGDDRLSQTIEGLAAILAMADYATPHEFLETLLSGQLQARRRLLQRLGPEARDPIEELVASALEFESGAAPSLQRFLDWFARGDVEIVRDPSAPLDAVRVMTVHGAKGLQAPVVILADACGDPDRRGGGNLAWLELAPDGPAVPIFRPRQEELGEPLASQLEEQERRDREEHWRLFYVAATRAEQRLYIGGALGAADREVPAESSWYRAAERSLEALGVAWGEEPVWGQALHLGDPEAHATAAPPPPAARSPSAPDWLHGAAPAEARPPRPLVPTAPLDDDVAEPPPTPAMRAAAERGKILHQLFERLPGVPPERRRTLAGAWLEHAAGVSDATVRDRLVEDACAIIEDPGFADIFGPDALAEAPVAAVVPGGHVVAGTIDRLLVAPDRIRLVDFKTGRDAPASPDAIPAAHLRQMAAYVAALEAIFPGRKVEAALLYTSGPLLHGIDRALLERHMPFAAIDG